MWTTKTCLYAHCMALSDMSIIIDSLLSVLNGLPRFSVSYCDDSSLGSDIVAAMVRGRQKASI